MAFLAPLLAAGGGAGAAGAAGAAGGAGAAGAAPIAAGAIPGLQGGAPLVGGQIAQPSALSSFMSSLSSAKPAQAQPQQTAMQIPQIQNPLSAILNMGNGTNPFGGG